ncbi:MAG: hypothetical protein EBQ89_02855, partial [Alphaproteobacteria bacterium]|nr:hypothetical protein [Alphaproteobacteria bacterium]
ATSVRILPPRLLTDPWSLLSELAARFTPDVSPDVDAVKTAETLPIVAMRAPVAFLAPGGLLASLRSAQESVLRVICIRRRCGT